MLVLYGLLGTTAAFLVATLPFIAAVFFSPLIAIGGPIVLAVGGFSIGPAWVAALYTMRAYSLERDIEPFRLFLRGYRLGWRQALLFWAPYFALLVVLAIDLTSTPGLPAPLYWLLAALGAAAVLWGGTVLVIVAFFSFRLRDAMRLAVYGLTRSGRWLLADAALMLVVGGLVYAGSEIAAGILVAPIALATVVASRPLVRRLTEEFTS
jgi:uncharacterized membrane protein YesL